MCLADNSYYHGALLYSFLCIFDLEDSTLRGASMDISTLGLIGGWGCCSQSYRIIVIVISEHGGFSKVTTLKIKSQIMINGGNEFRRKETW